MNRIQDVDRVHFLGAVVCHMRKHPEEFQGCEYPHLSNVSEEVRDIGGKTVYVCGIPGAGIRVRGFVDQEMVVLEAVEKDGSEHAIDDDECTIFLTDDFGGPLIVDELEELGLLK